MAIIDTATLVIGAGNYFLSPTGTAVPANLAVTPASPWVNIGHTALDEIFGLTSEGGEATNIGTLQNRTLRTTYSDRTEAINIVLQQFDADSLKLYFGSNMVSISSGAWLGVHNKPASTEKAFLAIFLDGTNVFGIYAPKVEIYRREDLSVDDADSLAGLPLGIKPIQYQTNDWTYAVTPLAAA